MLAGFMFFLSFPLILVGVGLGIAEHRESMFAFGLSWLGFLSR
jgi:hypothetical protein